MLAEMETGEGKTLTATLPAATAALAGVPVHVVTVNDYLAERDAERMRPLYDALGLTVGADRSRAGSRERAARRLRLRHHLLHQQGARLRLPARPACARPRTRRRVRLLLDERCMAAATARPPAAARACISPSSTRPTACWSTRRARR